MATDVRVSRNRVPTPSLRSALDRIRTGQPSWYATKSEYIVPNNQLKPYVEQIREKLLGCNTVQFHCKEGEGWKEIVAERAAITIGCDRDRIIRRLYDIMNDKIVTVPTEMAEAIIGTNGWTLDHDTDIPTLPGSKWSAHDLLYVRASTLDPDVDPHALLPFVKEVIDLSVAIVKSPELTSQLQDDAPFNCLRAWRFV